MNEIYHALLLFNQTALAVLILTVVYLILDPRMAGAWLAERDIAYDQIWMTHVGDCDCGDTLE